MLKGQSKHRYWLGTTAFLGILLLLWHWLGYPYSFDEARFLFRLSVAKAQNAQTLNLAELMPGDWEMVCESHGYDMPLYLDRYGKTYDPVGPAQDSTWGLIFISADGSFKSASGSCRAPGLLPLGGCLERKDAVLVRSEHGRADCPAFVSAKRW
jgi:hypothetical protein